MAGIVLERAVGRRFPSLLRDLLWLPLGARSDGMITVDRLGTVRAAGGFSVTARDLARVGELVRTGGGGVVPQGLIDDLRTGGNREAWANGDQAHLFPGGSYRNYWYETGKGELAAIGIHGQWIWISPETETVIVKQSCQPLPADPVLDQALIAMFRRIAVA
jgi:CubicO group peptidase (beta-lactamase class C family)